MTAPAKAPRPVSRLLRGRSPLFRLVLLAAAVAVAAPADAENPTGSILHEFVPPDPNEDVSFAATTLEGDLPAAIQTPSGLSTAPDPRKPPGADHVYSGATTDDSPDSTYEPDRDTRRPNVENYDDPFSPATAPFKRLRAYDWVDPDYSLRVRDSKVLKPVPVGGSVSAADEPFYGDMSVDLLPGQPVRIPTVGPGRAHPPLPRQPRGPGRGPARRRRQLVRARQRSGPHPAGDGARHPPRHLRERVRRRRLERARHRADAVARPRRGLPAGGAGGRRPPAGSGRARWCARWSRTSAGSGPRTSRPPARGTSTSTSPCRRRASAATAPSPSW